MNDFKQVSLDWVRQAAVVDDKAESFNLFLGIAYIKKDGSELSTRQIMS